MYTIRKCVALLLAIFAINFCVAQSAVKKDTIKVWGNCGQCKKKIEKAAKSAGANTASWSEETNILNVSYNPLKTNPEKIQKSIAASGYDTRDFMADDKAYKKLDKCCQYSRKSENK